MPYSVEPDVGAPYQSKPILNSYDSAPEFSLARWLEARRLVELAERDDRESKGYLFDDSLLVSH